MEISTKVTTDEIDNRQIINVDFIVKGKKIGAVELILLKDEELSGSDTNVDEYLLNYYRDDLGDPNIITQGNI